MKQAGNRMKSNLRKIRGHRIKTPGLTSTRRRRWGRAQLNKSEVRLQSRGGKKTEKRGRGRPPRRLQDREPVEAAVLPVIQEEKKVPAQQHRAESGSSHSEAPSGPLQLYLREIGEVK